MRFRGLRPWAALSLLALLPLLPLCAVPAESQQRTARVLTLEEALALARERGGTVILARGRIEEARARQAQAGRRFQENPVLEVDGGYRCAGDGFFDFEAAVTQGLDAGRGGPPGWRGRRPRWTAPRRSWRKPGACCCGRSGPVSSAA